MVYKVNRIGLMSSNGYKKQSLKIKYKMNNKNLFNKFVKFWKKNINFFLVFNRFIFKYFLI